ncbi:MAG: hypothetical protein JXX29_17045 [Deltaproteobacteria bacterium]|nr:hypothetical protein [Deltaproteobacteria bacterium]MBN2673394.1 hypothetical protein [Deltaproteobacteria bacterium]
MGKVATHKIIIINNESTPATVIADAPMLLTPEGPAQPPEPMHLNEEMVLVFDEHGNVIGNVGHEQVKELR